MVDLAAHGIATEFIERVAGADPVMSRITVTAGGERYVAVESPRGGAVLGVREAVFDALFEAVP